MISAVIPKFLLFASTLMASAVLASTPAADFPTQAVRIVIPYSPGGITDLVSRALAERLSKQWEKPVIVENKPGGGEVIAATTVATSKPDGHTILLASDLTFITNGLMRNDLPYNADTDFEPVLRLAEGVGLLVVNPALGVKSVGELMKLSQDKPGEITYGSSGRGSEAEFRMRILGAASGGYQFNHIPYKGSGDVLIDFLAGRLNSAWLPPHLTIANRGSKNVVPIGITGATRSALFPDVPTLQEQGYRGVEVASFRMMLATAKGTPKAVVDQIAEDVAAIIKEPAFNEKYLKANGYTLIADDPERFKQYLVQVRPIFADLVKKAGLNPN